MGLAAAGDTVARAALAQHPALPNAVIAAVGGTDVGPAYKHHR